MKCFNVLSGKDDKYFTDSLMKIISNLTSFAEDFYLADYDSENDVVKHSFDDLEIKKITQSLNNFVTEFKFCNSVKNARCASCIISDSPIYCCPACIECLQGVKND